MCYNFDVAREGKDMFEKQKAKAIFERCNHGNGMYKKTEVYQNAILKFIRERCGL